MRDKREFVINITSFELSMCVLKINFVIVPFYSFNSHSFYANFTQTTY